ncbi:hypothetical protein [Moraxella lacunata]
MSKGVRKTVRFPKLTTNGFPCNILFALRPNFEPQGRIIFAHYYQ